MLLQVIKRDPADVLGMSGGEVGHRIETGQLPLERGGKWLAIPEAAIDDYLLPRATR